MDVLDFACLIASGVGLVAYLCRLDVLKWGQHSASVILLHIGLGVSCLFAGFHAFNGESGPLDVSAVVGALAWIWLSVPTWGRGNVPRQFETSPAPLSSEQARHVAGGTNDHG